MKGIVGYSHPVTIKCVVQSVLLRGQRLVGDEERVLVGGVT